MEDIVWEEALQNSTAIENGIQTIALKDLGKYVPNIGEIVGYNGILKGDSIIYNGKKYTVVMVSTMGDFGLSETGKLPYTLRVSPSEVKKA